MLELRSGDLRVTFSRLGARLVSVFFGDADMMAGGGNDEQFLAGDWTAGAICGRIAGRITRARFRLDGVEHRLVPNMGEHQLHGGPDNFAIRKWDVRQMDNSIRFSLHSPDGDQGFPGAVDAAATYAISGNHLSLDLEARTTRPTVVNLTNHGYWNLSGGARNAFAHDMQIDAESFLPLDDLLLPTGEIRAVAGSRWDFRKLRQVREPYDNCWVLTGRRGELRHGLTLGDAGSGRRMEVWTSEAGLQMYTALHWNGGFPGRSGPLKQYGAIATEPQNFPDAPSHPNFPSPVLRPGETYRNRMQWRFF
ncbi:MAG: galactose mutarotase [Rhizobiales bacterium]|nr:galactose mutarotase [Hyphomicrobiales bacterium]MBI3674387.1 galactose mutarotase [Hyphomicrobiales bacterium]